MNDNSNWNNDEVNRRYFPRIRVRSHATLKDSRGRTWPVHLLDLSFNGALAALIHQHDLNAGERVVLEIEDDGPGGVIRMEGHLSHQKEHFLGIQCRASGVENQICLRELLKRSQRKFTERSYTALLKDYRAEFVDL